MKRIIVLASGSGTNLQALIDASKEQAFAGEIVGIISNNPNAYCLERASKEGIASATVDHRAFLSREDFEEELDKVVAKFTPDLILLAGFMRILTPVFVDKYLGKLVNIHPSLLPKYPGLNTHQRALDAGDAQAGATVHFVTAELDGGPPIIHGTTSTQADDDSASLANRILNEVEHHIFPIAVKWFCEDRLHFRNGQAILDDEPINECGISWQEPSQVS